MEGWPGFVEGDYVLTVDGLFFAVKGVVHDGGLILSILRYVPDASGDRVVGGVRYRRVYDLAETSGFLRSEYPVYVNYVPWLGLEAQSVPVDKVIRVFKPVKKLGEVVEAPGSALEETLASFVLYIAAAVNIEKKILGVSGSLLIGLENEGSDIDLIVYGVDAGLRVYDALRRMREGGLVKPLTGGLFSKVVGSRWGDTGLPLGVFEGIEEGKLLHGTYEGVEYFIRLLALEEVSESVPLGDVTLRAEVLDASHSVFTPCVYGVRQLSGPEVNVTELKSYRGKFTEQVGEGDLVEVRGTLERVKGEPDYYRLILGKAGDYLLPVDSLG